MQIEVIIISLLGVLFVIGSIVMVRSQKRMTQGLLQQMQYMSDITERKLIDFTRDQRDVSQNQSDKTQRLIQEITKELTEVKEANKSVQTITQSLQHLEKVLTNQKHRGTLGEQGLQLILENILPPQLFEFQYTVSQGFVVDAIVYAGDIIIPIDAKFSLDSYNKYIEASQGEKLLLLKKVYDDMKKRIDETAKYIKPEEGTGSFALMYLPAEGMYYDLLIGTVGNTHSQRSLLEYANQEKKVIIVSPTTLVAYLYTIIHGYKTLQIEKKAEHIQKNVQELEKHLRGFEGYFEKLGKHLETASKAFFETQSELKKVDKDIIKITNE